MTEYEVKFLNRQGLEGGITVQAADVQSAITAANESASSAHITKITAVLPWKLIDQLTKKDFT